jgi:uncharacterized protein (TIGR03437 family)
MSVKHAVLLAALAAAVLAQPLPPPTITALSPSSVTAGTPGFTLVVTGTRFRQDSQVIWRFGSIAAAPLTTRFVSETRLDADLSSALLADAAQIEVVVQQPGDAGQTLISNRVTFAIFAGISIATACPLPNAVVGQPYSQMLAPNGGTPPYTWFLAQGTLPPGLSLAPSGLIAGTATAALLASFTIRVSDAQGNTAQRGCALTSILGQQGQSMFITSLEPTGVVAGGGALTLTIRGLGFVQSSVAVWNFGASPVDLPTTFVDVNTVRAEVAAPLIATAGTFRVAVRQTVLTRQEFSNAEPFTVTAALAVGGSCPLRDAVVGNGYSEQLSATGGFTPYIWSILSGALPPGMSIQREGTISGTPSSPGLYPFTLAVTDARGNSANRSCSLRVLGPITANPGTVAFAGEAGAEWPGARDISIGVGSPDAPYTVSVSTQSGGNWLRATPLSQNAPSIVRLTAETTTLPAGAYTGLVTITSQSSSNRTVIVPVTLTLSASGGARLLPRPRALVFQAPRESGRRFTQLLTVGVAGGGSRSFTVSAASRGDWLSVAPGSGDAAINAPALITVTAVSGTLAAGTYAGAITLRSTGIPDIEVPVTLTVGLGFETLVTSQSGILLSAIAGGPNPSGQNLHVSTGGPNGFFWDSGTATLNGGGWLTTTASSGAARPGELSSTEVRAQSVDLGSGLYTGDVVVNTSSADNSSRRVGVHLDVQPATGSLPLEVFPGALRFNAPVTTARSVTIRNPNRQPVEVLVTLAGDRNVWSIAGDDFRSLLTGESRTVAISANPAGLQPGQYRATLFVQSSTPALVRSVELILIVPPADCAAGPPVLLAADLASGFRAVSGLPVALDVELVDSCGRAIEGASVTARPEGSLSGVVLQPVGSGRYAASWTVRDRPAGQLAISVHAMTPFGRPVPTLVLAGTVVVNPGVPVIGEEAILSAASLRQGIPLSPGGIFSLFGIRISRGSNAAQSVPLPDQLGPTRILVDGNAAPMFFAGEFATFGQVNGMLPFTLTPNTTHQFAAMLEGIRSAYVDVPIASASPAVFTFNQSGSGQGIVVDGINQRVLVAPASPTTAGQVIVIYCEGLGAVNRAVTAGAASPSDPPATARDIVEVTIGGRPARVLFAGLTPESVGLYQINAEVPSGIAASDQSPVVVTVNGIASRPVTIAVR